MSNALSRQATDVANRGGVGTKGVGSTGLGERVGEYEKANKINDGGSSMKGKKQPRSPQGTDV